MSRLRVRWLLEHWRWAAWLAALSWFLGGIEA